MRVLVLSALLAMASAFVMPALQSQPDIRGRSIMMGSHRGDQAKRRRTSFLRHVNAPLHERRTIMSSPLSKELRAEYGGVRSIPVRTGDEVVVTAGDHRKKTGKVIGVDRKKFYIHVEGITREKAGAKEAGKTSTTIPVPIRASKVRITKLFLDSTRETILKRKAEGRAAEQARKSSISFAEPGADPAWKEYQSTLQSILDGSA
uniref:Plastid ribosomal protein L26 n=1 Tax=Monodopsis sp. MarTras21 TaxID=1745953 RepID=A0A451FLH7_9STRA|nr:plastid ribosomal protein L26 [Monodopsis sp. MarTras21]